MISLINVRNVHACVRNASETRVTLSIAPILSVYHWQCQVAASARHTPCHPQNPASSPQIPLKQATTTTLPSIAERLFNCLVGCYLRLNLMAHSRSLSL